MAITESVPFEEPRSGDDVVSRCAGKHAVTCRDLVRVSQSPSCGLRGAAGNQISMDTSISGWYDIHSLLQKSGFIDYDRSILQKFRCCLIHTKCAQAQLLLGRSAKCAHLADARPPPTVGFIFGNVFVVHIQRGCNVSKASRQQLI
jgi:predicted RNA-binding Zn-ribbon protein involved in translation (DUF1610 family)